MKVLVVADIGNQIKIDKYIHTYKHFFGFTKAIEIYNLANKDVDLSDYDCVVVD